MSQQANLNPLSTCTPAIRVWDPCHGSLSRIEVERLRLRRGFSIWRVRKKPVRRCQGTMEESESDIESMLRVAEQLSSQGRFSEAKATIVVLSALYPSDAEIHYAQWKLSCLANDMNTADRAITAVASNPDLMSKFCRRLLMEVSSDTDLSAFGRSFHRQSLAPDLTEKFVVCCLSQLPSPGSGSDSDYTLIDAMPVLRRLARITGHHVLIWWRAAAIASVLADSGERGDAMDSDGEGPRKRARWVDPVHLSAPPVIFIAPPPCNQHVQQVSARPSAPPAQNGLGGCPRRRMPPAPLPRRRGRPSRAAAGAGCGALADGGAGPGACGRRRRRRRRRHPALGHLNVAFPRCIQPAEPGLSTFPTACSPCARCARHGSTSPYHPKFG